MQRRTFVTKWHLRWRCLQFYLMGSEMFYDGEKEKTTTTRKYRLQSSLGTFALMVIFMSPNSLKQIRTFWYKSLLLFFWSELILSSTDFSKRIFHSVNVLHNLIKEIRSKFAVVKGIYFPWQLLRTCSVIQLLIISLMSWVRFEITVIL